MTLVNIDHLKSIIILYLMKSNLVNIISCSLLNYIKMKSKVYHWSLKFEIIFHFHISHGNILKKIYIYISHGINFH